MFDTLIFIDETFLEKLSKYFGKGNYLKYDKVIFANNLARNQNLSCKKIFYYTSPPFQSPAPTKEEESKRDGYDRFVNKLKERGVAVREGRCQRLKIDGDFIFKQKAVDVLLAMDLTNVLIEFPNIKRIILISSDSDFVPVIKNLQKKGVKIILHTYYEKKRNTSFSRSNDLIKSVYKYVLLTKKDFDNSPLKNKNKGDNSE
ncbi:MAG: NYN domain-containing protein [Nanoarchaeota archaeon]|mgnify:FL=1